MPRRPYSVQRTDTQPISIALPALISDELFAAAAEALGGEPAALSSVAARARFVLEGLLVCPTCGYACRMRKQTDDQPRCTNPPMDVTELDDMVWRDVCQLLRQPAQIEAEYERRLRGHDDVTPLCHNVAARIGQLKRGIARLIDAYSEGLLDKEEFKPKIRASKERLARLESEADQGANQEAQRAELRLVIGKLQDFTAHLNHGLEHADWSTRRAIIRALVKQIEVRPDQVCLTYRVNAVPFVKAPDGGIAQDCWGSHDSVFWHKSLRCNGGVICHGIDAFSK